MRNFEWVEIGEIKIRAINTPNGLYTEQGEKIKLDDRPWQYATALPNDQVRFVSAIPFLSYPIEKQNDLFFVMHRRKEVMVICSDELRKVFQNIPSLYFHQTLKNVKLYCIANGISFVESYGKTTKA